MSKTDKFLSLLLLGLLAPVTLMLACWWGSVPFIKDNDQAVMLLAIFGFAVGCVLDFTVLRKFIHRLFGLLLPTLLAVEVFYSIMVYGFFMGFPVFNSFIGIVGAYIVARGGLLRQAAREETLRNARALNLASLGILAFLCFSTATLALRESTIKAQMKGMLGLPFDVTDGMIWGTILIGGSLLLFFQFFASKWVVRSVLRKAGG